MDDRRERNTGRSGRESGSKRKIFRRTVFLMLVCGVGLFIPLIGQLWNIAIVHHEEYQAEAVEQQTRDVEVAAFRGSIYDSSGDVLAMSATVYNLILSPRDLEASVDESKYKDEEGNADLTAYQAALQAKKDLVLDGVLAVLDLDREALADRLERTYSQYEVLKTNIEKEQAEQLRAFITENKLSHFLYLTPTTKRYYPYGDLAAHVLGFCNSEGGAYGVEAIYNDVLEGTVGRVVTTRTGTGVEMYDSYSEYVDAEDGCDLTLTIDTTIQSYAERILEEGIKAYDVQRGGWCVVLDPQTGAVLAMASSPDYDPNQYGTIRDESLRAQVEADVQAELEKRQGEKAEGKTDEEIYQEAVNAATGTAQNKQWRSQAVNDTYEPGSTFKALVLAAALEEGVVSESDTFYCPGYYMVEGWPKPISCSKKAPGHGTQTLAEAVQNSCNPAFMQIGQRLGIEKFYEYFQAFGLTEPTNIDLNGEGVSTVWPLNTMTGVDLAVGSFGQRFTVTPIQMITAFAATINGGKLLQPYVVQTVTAADGTVVENTEPTVVRQVVSQETSDKCREILTSVVMAEKGTGKNARQAGYTIGGKTGTSETTVPGEVVVSFMGFAPADDPQIIVLIAYDHPQEDPNNPKRSTTGVYISGGNMGAPMAGKLIGEILDYLGVEKEYTADEAALADLQTPKVTGMTPADAEAALEKKGLDSRTVGEGETVTAQVPAAGSVIPGESTVILYLGGAEPEETGTVPDVTGMSFAAARSKLESAGFFMRAAGAATYLGSSSKAQGQSVAGGETAAIGTIVDVTFSTPQVEDGYLYDG